VARRPFTTPDAHIVVSTDGYFDVFALGERSAHGRPAYRGAVAELGATVRGPGDTLSVRPDSIALRDAVSVWSANRGAAAVRGDLGAGRDAAQAARVLAAAVAAAAVPAKSKRAKPEAEAPAA
jgi:hypothetical protein